MRRERARTVESKTIQRLQQLFKERPEGLSVSETIKLARKLNILHKPNTIIEYLGVMERLGILSVNEEKSKRGRPRRIHKLAIPVESDYEEIRDMRRVIKAKKAVFRLSHEEDMQKLKDSPSDYWILFLLDVAKRAGLTGDLRSSQEKFEFFDKLVDKTVPYYVSFSRALMFSTDISYTMIKAMLGATLLQIYEGRKVTEDVVSKRCEIVATDWSRWIAEVILSAINEGAKEVETPGTHTVQEQANILERLKGAAAKL